MFGIASFANCKKERSSVDATPNGGRAQYKINSFIFIAERSYISEENTIFATNTYNNIFVKS